MSNIVRHLVKNRLDQTEEFLDRKSREVKSYSDRLSEARFQQAELEVEVQHLKSWLLLDEDRASAIDAVGDLEVRS